MIRSIAFLCVSLMASQWADAKLITQRVEYKEGDTVLEGYLAYNDRFSGKRPGVLVVHEWMGLGEYSENRARQLADLGYIAFAADIYGKGVRPKDAKEAGEFAGKYKADRALLRSRAQAALQILKAQKKVNSSKVAAIGYCFGGTTVLELARSGADVQGVVSFHGGLDTKSPDDAKNIKAKVLVLHGNVDPFVKPKEVQAFFEEMNEASVDYQFVAYSDAVHSFTNPDAGNDPSKGAAYNKKADQRSFEQMKSFFKEIF